MRTCLLHTTSSMICSWRIVMRTSWRTVWEGCYQKRRQSSQDDTSTQPRTSIARFLVANSSYTFETFRRLFCRFLADLQKNLWGHSRTRLVLKAEQGLYRGIGDLFEVENQRHLPYIGEWIAARSNGRLLVGVRDDCTWLSGMLLSCRSRSVRTT